MGPFDFLNDVKRGLQQYFAPAQSRVSDTISQFFPTRSQNFRLDKSANAPDITSVVDSMVQQPTPTPDPRQQAISAFQQGFDQFGGNPPIATASGALVDAAQQLPQPVDPFLPAIIALMESGGGAHVPAPFNAFGLRSNTGFAGYPNFETAILGGPNNGIQSQGFLGTVLNHPAYETFRSTGNLEDFFSSYTPAVPGNPTLEELMMRYDGLRALFPPSL